MPRGLQAVLLGLVAASCRPEPPLPEPPEPDAINAARQIVSRLDYVAADYPLAVKDSAVIDADEYDEQLEMLAEVRDRLETLEAPAAERAAIERLEAMIRDKVGGPEVASRARDIADAVLSRRNLTLAPIAAPDRDRARSQFAENCVKCHGPGGGGDGPQAGELKVKPRNLEAPEVAESLSMRRVFNAVTDGMPEAEMPQFDLLSVEDRWGLAAYVLTLRFGDEAGTAPARVPPRVELANRTNAELAEAVGADGLAHLRAVETFAPPAGPLAPIAEAVGLAVARHREGKRPAAADHLDAAIAEIYAPLRPALVAREPAVAWRLETELYALRAAIADSAARQLEQRAHAVLRRLDPAEAELADLAPIAIAGIAALAALGWIVVVIACGGAAARASGYRHVGRAVHLGWAIAAIAGGATLFAGGGEIDLSAASQRHQLVAVLRGLGAIAGGVATVALLRRLALPVQRPSQTDTTPWWLAMLVFAVGYGGALEAAARVDRIAAATGGGKLELLAAAVVVVAALAALLRLLAEARRRIGDAPYFALCAAAALLASIALAGQATGALVDIGSVASPPGGRRFDPLAIYPGSITAGAQLAVAGLIAAAAVFALISRRAEGRGGGAS